MLGYSRVTRGFTIPYVCFLRVWWHDPLYEFKDKLTYLKYSYYVIDVMQNNGWKALIKLFFRQSYVTL